MKTIRIPELARRHCVINSRFDRTSTREAVIDAKDYEIVEYLKHPKNLFCAPYFWYDLFYEDGCV